MRFRFRPVCAASRRAALDRFRVGETFAAHEPKRYGDLLDQTILADLPGVRVYV
jgi:hypothetical protein